MLTRVFCGFLITLVALAVLPAGASTTLEKSGWCAYSDETGKRVLEGTCQINWGIVGVGSCEPETNIVQRYIVRYSKQSEAVAFLRCDRTAVINDVPAVSGYGTFKGRKVIQILTIDKELFEFEVISE